MQLFSNNAKGVLDTGISNVATSIVLGAGQGSLFAASTSPDTSPDFEMITVTDGNAIEVMKVTLRTVDTLTVVRAQEGTIATAFVLGDAVEARATKGTFERMESKLSADIEPVVIGNGAMYL